jgi:hypothetical protein
MAVRDTTPSSRLRAAVAFLAALVMVLGVVLAWPRLAERRQSAIAERLAAGALEADDSRVRDAIGQLPRLGLTAIEPLVRLATSQRTAAALAAQDSVADLVASWQVELAETGNADLHARRIDRLSVALDQHARRFGEAGQRWAHRMARQLVTACAALPAERVWPVLARCERVLAAAAAGPPSVAQPEETAGGAVPPTLVATAPPDLRRPAPASPLAGATLPPNSTLEVAHPQGAADLAIAPPADNAMKPPVADNPLRSSRGQASPAEAVAFGANAEPIGSSEAVDVPSPQDMRHTIARFREISDRQLIGWVDAGTNYEAAAARRLLHERGYSDALLELARRLQNRPAIERREALDRASLLPAAEARRLLRWFVADDDPEVRLKALALLATSGDPQLHQIARRRAIEDADPRVAELAEKLMQ